MGCFAIGLGLGLALWATGCVTSRMPLESLPERPIAFLHWDDRAGAKRSEIFEKRSEVPPLPQDDDPERLEELQLRAYLRGDELLQIRSELAKHPGRLMLFWPRTGEMEPVEAAPLDSIPLSWSADGRRLLIASAHRGGREQLYEYDRERRDLRPVTLDDGEHPRGDYDARGRVVAQRITRPRSVGVSDHTVHRIGLGGGSGRPLAEGVPPGTLRVMPAGDRIVYEQVIARPRRDGPTFFESWIAIRGLGGDDEEALLAKGREPTLTPDGRWIVFASPSSAGYRLRRMRPDGTSRVAIDPGGAEERMPAVSPDGGFVAFVKLEYGRRRLAVRSYDGKDERVLVASGWSEFPVW